MKCAIQSLELTLPLEKAKYKKLYDKANGISYEKYGYDALEQVYDFDDDSLMGKGLLFSYLNHPYRGKQKRILLSVSPSVVIGKDERKLWTPSPDNISRLCDALEKHISNYFNGKYSLDAFKISHVQIAADIDVGSSSLVLDYIKLLHSIGRVKCFSPIKHDRNGYRIERKQCFALKGNSNGIEFRAGQSKHNESVLRVIVELTKPSTIRAYTGEADIIKQISALAKNCEPILMDTFGYIIPPGDHYKKPKAEKLIYELVSDGRRRRRMLRLLTLIPEKKSLHLALKSLNYRNFMDVMADFETIGLSPITISKRHDVKELKSLYSHINK